MKKSPTTNPNAPRAGVRKVRAQGSQQILEPAAMQRSHPADAALSVCMFQNALLAFQNFFPQYQS